MDAEKRLLFITLPLFVIPPFFIVIYSVYVVGKSVKKSFPHEGLAREQEDARAEGLLVKKFSEIDKQKEILYQQINFNLKKEELLEKKLTEVRQRLSEIASMSEDEARQKLFENAHDELKKEIDISAKKQLRTARDELHAKVTKITSSAIERYSSQIVFSKTTDYLVVEDKKIVSRIIGRDGRNITLFRKLTGTDIIIDKEKDYKEKKKLSGIVVTVSSFNSLRREVAVQTLKKLVQDEQKITPLYIEKIFEETSLEIDLLISKVGEGVLDELQLTNVNPELVKYLGRLKYRTSYGQNVLEHCLEVAKLSGTIAAELGLDPAIAKRAGLFHDIGKATEDLTGSSHITSGVMLAQNYNESEVVVNSIVSHHDRTLANSPYSLIVGAADTLSAARPGARANQLESYVLRMRALEEIANEFEGIKKVYSFQAGREIWVIIDSNRVSDLQCTELARSVREKINEKIVIPGDITLSVIREKRIVEKIVNSGRVSNP